MKKSILSLFLLCSFNLLSQNFTISGKVLDSQDNRPLPGAHISLTHPWGEEYQKGASNENGTFLIEHISKGGYILKISFVGYEDFQKEITISTENIDMGTITLSEGVVLSEVEIRAKIPLAEQKGDTTQYNADAFKVMNDASAEELIEKMPGVVIDNGKVQAQGEDVKEVLVDGKPFFGNDPTAALRNLPAEVVDKIQVFDQSSDQANFTGFDDGETTKTINIITRSNMRNGQFGKVYGGYGYEDKYQAGGNASMFDGQRRISIIGMTNNINQQNFATEDLLGVVGSSGRRGRGGYGGRGGGSRGSRGGGGSTRDFLINQQGGIATTNALGINYSDNWGKKFEITGSYFFNMTENESSDLSRTEYFDSESISEFYDEENSSLTDNYNHRLNFRINYNIDSMNSIIMRPRLSFQKNDGLSATFGQTLFGTELLNQTDNTYQSILDGINFSNSFTFRHKFKKSSRTLSLNLSQRYNDKAGESYLNSEDLFFGINPLADTLNQFSLLDINGWTYSSNVSYTEPLGKSGMLMLSYRFSQTEDDSDKQTFDFESLSQDYSFLNEELSNVFNNIYQNHTVSTGYNYRKGRNLMMMARASLQWSDLNSNETFPVMNLVERSYFNVLPFVMLRYNVSKQENLRVFYSGRTSSPSVEQLQNVIDNSNPIQLTIGNPNLDQSYSHRFNARYSKTNTTKATIFYAMISGSYSDNYITNATYLEETDNPIFDDIELARGSQLSRPVNLGGYWNGRIYSTFGLPLGSLKTNLNLDVSANFSKTPGQINDQINHSTNKTIGLGLTFSSNISENVDFTLSTRSNYNKASNSVQEQLNSRYLYQNSRVKFNLIIPGGIVFRTNVTHQFYTGLSDGFDDSFFLWTAAIGKKLFKNQRGELSLAVFDILEQNQSIKRNVTEIYIEDLRSMVLQRYAMLTFTYNFRNFSTGKQIQQRGQRKDSGRWMGDH